MTGDQPVDLVTRLAAALRADADDLSLYAGFLLSTLTQALPAHLVEIDRKRTLRDRMRGGQGQIVGVHVALGDQRYSLLRPAPGAPATATIGHFVGGVVLSTSTTGLDEWATALSRSLLARAETDSATAANLARAFGLT